MAMPMAGLQPPGYHMLAAGGISAGMANPAAHMGMGHPGVFTGAPAVPLAAAQIPSGSFFMQPQEVFPPFAAPSFNTPYPPGAPQAHNGVALVSLGCNCGPKMSFDAMGCGQESLPFDWMCTTIEGVIMLLRTDFEAYFDFDIRERSSSGGVSFEVFRSATHSWWHADPTDPATQETYTRRIHRLNAMQAHSLPILFVRILASTYEFPLVGQLMQTLLQTFGPMSKLLVIILAQNQKQSFLFDSMPNLLIFLMPVACGKDAYCEPISIAQRWVAGQSPHATHLQSLDMIPGLIPSHTGYFGMGGLAAFENLPPGIPWPRREDGQPHVTTGHLIEWSPRDEIGPQIGTPRPFDSANASGGPMCSNGPCCPLL